jgi:hypothetical protein
VPDRTAGLRGVLARLDPTGGELAPGQLTLLPDPRDSARPRSFGRSRPDQGRRAGLGRRVPLPRWETPLPPEAVATYGPLVAAWASTWLGIELRRWQRRVLDRALACDADGRLVHRLYLSSTPRQAGKTTVCRALVGWAMTAAPTRLEWRSIANLATDARQARLLYDAVATDALGTDLRHRYRRVTSFLGMTGAAGEQYEYLSRQAAESARGMTLDLALFDEVLTQRTMDTWAAIAPTIVTRPNGLVLGISTAGTDRSVLLRDWWERGLRIIAGVEPGDGFGMSWWAAPTPTGDRAGLVALANPSVGDGLDAGSVLRMALDAGSFTREALNLWTDAGDDLLPPGAWRRTEQHRELATDWPRIALAVHVAPSWLSATVTVAAIDDAGLTHAGVAGRLDATATGADRVAPGAVADLVTRLAASWAPSAIAWEAASSVNATMARLQADAPELPWRPMSATEVRSACADWYGALVAGEATHEPDALLTRQVSAAARSSEGDVWRLVATPGRAIDAILALVLATYQARERRRAPVAQVFV